MILGNGSEDPDPDLNEPDPIGVIRGTFSWSAWCHFTDMGQIQCMVLELNEFILSSKGHFKVDAIIGDGQDLDHIISC